MLATTGGPADEGIGDWNLHDGQADEAEISTCDIVSIVLILWCQGGWSSSSPDPANVEVGQASAGTGLSVGVN
jgi:hypothetical protein